MTSFDLYLEAFTLGNGAILTNVCVLPLYPGLIAFLAGTSKNSGQRGQVFLGLIVLTGVLSMLMVMGLLLYLVNRSFSSILDWLLPALYGGVIVLGLLMLLGRNPFATMSSLQSPVGRHRAMSALTYGFLLGPMTFPCAGPLVISVFVLGAGSIASLSEGIAYFLAFGVGFGWPLVVLPMIAVPLQRRAIGWLTSNYRLIGGVAGGLLVAIGIFGIWTDVLPTFE